MNIVMHDSTIARRLLGVLVSALLCLLLLAGCSSPAYTPPSEDSPSLLSVSSGSLDASAVADLADVPNYSGQDYIELSGGEPSFTEVDMAVPDGTEVYGELDRLGRTTGAFAKVCGRTQPEDGAVRDTNMPDPIGFVQAKYPDIGLDHLYDRTHLIAYSLTDEPTEARDLITGTRHMNQDVMTRFEKQIRDSIADRDMATYQENHVLMRVTPDFRDNELVPRGVQIEALSLEDGGESVRLNVYCYNVQPGVVIDYATGESRLADQPETSPTVKESETEYLLNTSTKRFHDPDCKQGNSAKPENRQTVKIKRSDLISQGYKPCGSCNP